MAVPRVTPSAVRVAIPQIRMYSAHHEETFEEFTTRYVFSLEWMGKWTEWFVLDCFGLFFVRYV